MTRLGKAVPGLGLALLLAACGGGSDSADQKPATTVAPLPAGGDASTAREVSLVSTARPFIDKLTDALRKGDAAASRKALDDYDLAWNGVEVYVNVRSKDTRYVKPGQEDLYATLETDLQAKLTDGLDVDPPAFATLVPLSEQLAKKYDEAIARSKAGPALSPLFDDVATVRIARAGLRSATAALGVNDLAKARTSFTQFQTAYPPAQALLKVRNGDAERETTAAITAAAAGFAKGGATVDEVRPLVAAVTDRYNYGLRFVNAAARNADPSRTAAAEDDLTKLRALNDAHVQLKASLTAWNAADYTRAGTAFTAANSAYTLVQPALAAKASDTDPTRALAAYGTTVTGPGDAAKVAAAHKTAVESVLVAQQVLVGQFWTDRKVQDFLAGLPTA